MNISEIDNKFIGKIRTGWEIRTLKTVCSYISDGSHFSPKIVDSGYPYITVGNVYDNEIHLENAMHISLEDFELLKRNGCQPQKGDVLLAKDGTVGRTAIVHDEDVVVLSSLGIIRPLEHLKPRFLKYVLDAEILQEQMKADMAGSALKRITIKKISNLRVVVAPIEEQDIIADYLDEKCGDIDSQVALLEKKRDAYARLKVSVINKAVTHGLNPDVSMRPSGIDWIGDIPAHWERLRLKDVSYMYSGLTGKSGDDFRCDDDTKTKPFVPFTNVLNNTKIDFNQFNRVVMAEGEQQNRVLENDIIFLMSSEDYESIAKSAVVVGDPGEVYLNSFCRGLHFTSNDIFAPFVNYQLNSEKYHDALRFEARGFTRINIKVDRVFSQFITVPPLAEQREIADYLDKKCGEIDAVVENLDKQIDAYKRLKKSLINEVVTGKRAV